MSNTAMSNAAMRTCNIQHISLCITKWLHALNSINLLYSKKNVSVNVSVTKGLFNISVTKGLFNTFLWSLKCKLSQKQTLLLSPSTAYDKAFKLGCGNSFYSKKGFKLHNYNAIVLYKILWSMPTFCGNILY